MFKIFLGFLPWILYLVIVGNSRTRHLEAIAVTLAVILLVDYKQLRQRYVLTWGSLIFFGLLFFIVAFSKTTWPEHNVWLLANSALMLIAVISLIIRKPFTLQYAREEVDPLFWESPRFIYVNQVITLVWTLTFFLQALLDLKPMTISHLNGIAYQIVSYLPCTIAIIFTKMFPTWYRGYSFRKLSKVKEDPTKNPYMQGNFAPIKSEIEQDHLSVVGDLPKDLSGVYMRNGPNPKFDPISYTYPIDGDGMLHAVYFEAGKARYKNRWVKTKGLLAEEKAGKALYGGIRKPIPTDPKLIGADGDPGPIKDGAFIHVIRHANKIIALYEAGIAYEMTEALETIGPWCPEGIATSFSVNAHTRLDLERQELIAFTYDLHTPHLRYYVLDAHGKVIEDVPIDKPYASMIHDFVITKDYIVFFDCPAIFDMKHAYDGQGLLQWEPDLGVTVILVHRKTKAVTKINTEAFFVYHFAQASQSEDNIFVDYVRHEKLFLGSGVKATKAPTLYRATINLKTQKVTHHPCLDRMIEFPRIHDTWRGGNMLRIIISAAFLIILAFFCITPFFKDSIILTAIISGLMFFICGFVFPMSMGKGISLFRHIAGTASATMFLINMLITSLCAFLVSFINVQSLMSILWVYLFILLVCALVYWGSMHKLLRDYQ